MNDHARRDFLKLSALASAGATLAVSTRPVVAHDGTSPPSIEETLTFLSSNYALDALWGVLVGTAYLTLRLTRNVLHSMLSQEDFSAFHETANSDRVGLIILGAPGAILPVYGEGNVREGVYHLIGEDDSATQEASEAIMPLVHGLIENIPESEQTAAVMTAVDALYHHERIARALELADHAEDNGDGGLAICRRFPFDYACKALGLT